MSIRALMELRDYLDAQLAAKFNGRMPSRKEVVGYSKGHWLVEYTFKESYGYSTEQRWEQDERSIAHQKEYPND